MRLFVATLIAILPSLALGVSFDRDIPFEQLIEGSSSVIHGVVAEVETTAGPSGLRTRYQIQTERYLVGDAPPATEITLPGGKLDGTVEYVPGMPTWSVGSQVVLCIDEAGAVPLRGMFTVRHGFIGSPGGLLAAPSTLEQLERSVSQIRGSEAP